MVIREVKRWVVKELKNYVKYCILLFDDEKQEFKRKFVLVKRR